MAVTGYIRYEAWSPRPETLAVVEYADELLCDYQSQGLTLTLRQLYYLFVARDLLPNTERSYKRLGDIVCKARLAGRIRWDAIEDRGRDLGEYSTWADVSDHLSQASRHHVLDWWAEQPNVAEVWVEKQALEGIVERAAEKWQCPYFSCRGYPSLSSVWAGAQRIQWRYQRDVTTTIIHLGDHDPSGVDMTRDIDERLGETFECRHVLTVKRIALTMEQIEELQPPPNPAKLTDSRARDYIRLYGRHSWELDALPPQYLDDLITAATEDEIHEPYLFEEVRERQAEDRTRMREIARQEAS